MAVEILTWGDIMRAFGEQFPGLITDNMRPNAPNQLYVWVRNSPTNIIATYHPGKRTFSIDTTYEGWKILD